MSKYDSTVVSTGDDPTKTILSDSALHKKYLCDYVINVATGCRHGCRFCYVPSTPNIRTRPGMLRDEAGVENPQEEWGQYVLYRDNIPDELPGILDRKRTWNSTRGGQGIIGVSFSTDPFMDDRAGSIAASVISTSAEHEKYVRILTRNTVLAADSIDVFKDASPYVTIGTSITTLKQEYTSVLEPKAPSPHRRLDGLSTFKDAGVPVYVSMSPTYPTLERDELFSLMERISTYDPDVVLHEPMNPRGSNFKLTVEAAEDNGLDTLASRFNDIRETETWVSYAVSQHYWAQQAAAEYDVSLNLLPDTSLIETAPDEYATWLREWRGRQSPESFADRPSPEIPEPELPSPPQWPWSN